MADQEKPRHEREYQQCGVHRKTSFWDELLAWIRWLDGSGCEDGVSKAATVTRAGRAGPSWQGSREESGDAEGQQADDRRVQDDDDEYGARDDGGRRSAVACLCDAPKVL